MAAKELSSPVAVAAARARPHGRPGEALSHSAAYPSPQTKRCELMSAEDQPKPRLARRLSLGALGALISTSAAKAAAGGAMPWDTPLTTIENDLTGPVVVAAATIAV